MKIISTGTSCNFLFWIHHSNVILLWNFAKGDFKNRMGPSISYRDYGMRVHERSWQYFLGNGNKNNDYHCTS